MSDSSETALQSHPTRLTALGYALALFTAWMAGTYLFEGLPRALLRPEAAALRLAYAVVVNLGIGVLGSLWVLRRLLGTGVLTRRSAGLAADRRAAIGAVTGLILGAALFLAQRPPTLDPVVLLNTFSQVFVVSTAEVLVCWSVAGAAIEAILRARRVSAPWAWAGVAASVLFGLYHFAHSSPFNNPRMVFFLSAVGLITSTFFFIARSAYGTILLHNFLGLFGVLDAMAQVGQLGAFERPALPLIATAVATIVLITTLQRAWLRPSTAGFWPASFTQ